MKKKKLFIILFICFLFLTDNVYADVDVFLRKADNLLVPDEVIVDDSNRDIILKTPAIDASKKIYDFADILTDKQEYKLFLSLNRYNKETGLDTIVVTTEDLLDFKLSDYANNIYSYNDFKKNAVIFVISLADSKPKLFMVSHGTKANSIYTNQRINDALEYLYKDIKEENYYNTINDYTNILFGFYNLEREGNYRVNKKGKIVLAVPYLEISIIACSITIVFIVISFIKLLSINKSSSDFRYVDLLDSSSMLVKTKKDELINTIVSDK